MYPSVVDDNIKPLPEYIYNIICYNDRKFSIRKEL